MTRQEWLSLWLHYGVNAQAKPFAQVSELFSSVEEAYDCACKRKSSAFAGVSDETKSRLFEAVNERFMDRYTAWLERHGVGITTLDSDDYPALLREIYSPPPLLFYRGRIEADTALPIALIGARTCTDYGKGVARTLGRQLAEHGATVVTGLADGIDTHATLGALDCETSAYPSIGVLGCGIDVVYPSGNKQLYGALAERGAVVTEFLPKTPALHYHFPIRNRIISGLSRAVAVVEAGERSGSSITMSHALEQGRDVFAVPGRITDPMSVGTNGAIVRGEAKPILSVTDILCEFASDVPGVSMADAAVHVPLSSLDELEQEVYRALSKGEKNIDELYELLACSINELNSVLTGMCFLGIIKQQQGRTYACNTLKIIIDIDS